LTRPTRPRSFRPWVWRCRERLVALIRELTAGTDLATGDDLPEAGNFIAWTDRIANAVAGGGSTDTFAAA
jgi:hypothetical protein